MMTRDNKLEQLEDLLHERQLIKETLDDIKNHPERQPLHRDRKFIQAKFDIEKRIDKLRDELFTKRKKQ